MCWHLCSRTNFDIYTTSFFVNVLLVENTIFHSEDKFLFSARAFYDHAFWVCLIWKISSGICHKQTVWYLHEYIGCGLSNLVVFWKFYHIYHTKMVFLQNARQQHVWLNHFYRKMISHIFHNWIALFSNEQNLHACK